MSQAAGAQPPRELRWAGDPEGGALFASLLMVRVHLERQRVELDRLYLALEDQP